MPSFSQRTLTNKKFSGVSGGGAGAAALAAINWRTAALAGEVPCDGKTVSIANPGAFPLKTGPAAGPWVTPIAINPTPISATGYGISKLIYNAGKYYGITTPQSNSGPAPIVSGTSLSNLAVESNTLYTSVGKNSGQVTFYEFIYYKGLFIVHTYYYSGSYIQELWTSPDLQTWTKRTITNVPCSRSQFLITNNYLVLFTFRNDGVYPSVQRSTDGLSWTDVTGSSPIYSYFQSKNFMYDPTNNKIVLCGYFEDNNDGHPQFQSYISTNEGASFTQNPYQDAYNFTNGSGGIIIDSVFTGTKFVGMGVLSSSSNAGAGKGAGIKIFQSTDGISWTITTLPLSTIPYPNRLNSLVYGNGTYLYSGTTNGTSYGNTTDPNFIYQSSDLSSFTRVSTSASTSFSSANNLPGNGYAFNITYLNGSFIRQLYNSSVYIDYSPALNYGFTTPIIPPFAAAGSGNLIPYMRVT